MADNRFVTELIVQMASGNAAAIEQFKKGLIDSGMAAKEAAKATAEFAKASATVTTALNQEADANRKAEAAQTSVNKAKAAALDITKQQAAVSRAAGGVGGGSLVGALYSDPATKQIATVQGQIAAANARLASASGDDILAWQAKVDNLNRKYGAFIQTMQQVAGVSKDAFLKNAGGEQIAAIINNAEKLNATLPKTGKHLDEVSTKGKFSTNQMLQYTAAIRNTAESLASGMSPATVAMTQGMQVLGAYMGENIGLMARLGIGALALSPVIIGVTRAMNISDTAAKMNSVLRVTGQTANMTAGEMFRLSESMKGLGAGRSEAIDAILGLQTSRAPGLGGADRWAKLAVDLQSAFGGDLAKSTDYIANSLEDIGKASKKASDMFKGSFTPEMLNAIDQAEALGDKAKAADIFFNAMSKRFSGEYSASMSTGAKLAHGLGAAFDSVSDSLARLFSQNARDMTAPVETLLGVEQPSRDVAKPRLGASRVADLLDLGRGDTNQIRSIYGDMKDLNRAFMEGQISAYNFAASMGNLEARLRELRPTAERMKESLSDQSIALQARPFARAGISARLSAERSAQSRVMTEAETVGRGMTRAQVIAEEGQLAFDTVERQRLASVGDAADALGRQTRAERELAAASFEGVRAMSLARAEAAKREAAAQGQNAAFAYAASLAKDEAAAMQTLGGEYSKLGSQVVFLNEVKTKGYEAALVEQRLRDAGLIGTKSEADARKALYDIIKRGNEVKNDQHRIDMRALDDQKALLAAVNDNISAPERAFRLAEIEANKSQDPTERQRLIDKAKAARDIANAQTGSDIRRQMDPNIARQEKLATIDQATGVSEADKLVARRLADREHRDALIARKEAEDDWASGADRALMKYSKSVGTVADQTERVMTNAFKSMEDAMVEFAMTGELSFEKMANSIISDLIRMQIQASITKPLSDAINGAGGVGGIISSLFSAHGNAFSAGGNVIPFAKGGVVNGVTPFRFGQGGAMSGIMGEAGPEAIVPLTRTPQGDLGIRSTGGGAQVKVEVIDQRGSGAPIDVETQMGAFGPIVRIIARDEANKAVQGYAKGGGLTNQLRQDYNIRQPAVNRG